jgi:long-chain acyl-CoA synthetase
MKRILARIAQHAVQRADQTALSDSYDSLSYHELQDEITRLARLIDRRRVALLLPNSCAWAVLDLALQQRGATCIPLPTFFSDAQLAHVLSDAQPDLVITDQPQRLAGLLPDAAASLMHLTVAGRQLTGLRRAGAARNAFPPDTAKLTYTSGTTGQPKGVCLSGAAMAEVTLGLSAAVQGRANDRALSLLPLSTLLENIGGLYAPLYSGARAYLPDLAECGFSGSSGVDAVQLLTALNQYRPTTTILVPQLLKVMVAAAEGGAPLPAGLRFVAVGGARCAAGLIERAWRVGLPVYEGYGLSEACSVVSLNLPGHGRAAGTGCALPHARVRIADDGEVVVSGTLFSGYLGQPNAVAKEWHTGDLGRLDADGNLHISGRKRDAYATAYGRNVSPDWVEGELLGSTALLQAAVFGEGRPANVAVLVPHPQAGQATIEAAVAEANRRLPDYARVHHWLVAEQPFTPANGLASAGGAVLRAAVAQAYAAQIEQLYAEEEADALV